MKVNICRHRHQSIELKQSHNPCFHVKNIHKQKSVAHVYANLLPYWIADRRDTAKKSRHHWCNQNLVCAWVTKKVIITMSHFKVNTFIFTFIFSREVGGIFGSNIRRNGFHLAGTVLMRLRRRVVRMRLSQSLNNECRPTVHISVAKHRCEKSNRDVIR